MKKQKIIVFALVIFIAGILISLFYPNAKSFASFVGSNNSNIYHRFDCSLVNDIEEKDKIWFDATIVNEKARYKDKQYFPCKVCKPPYKKADD